MTLSVSVSGRTFEFDGPHGSTDQLNQKSGTYVITTITVNQNHSVIDVGESGNVQRRVESHDRADQWKRHQQHGLYASAYYCDERNRMALEKAIRSEYNPPCGDR